ncbi:MAG TPA: aminodeoxychorismate/anthranilate synthase component II [Pirellulaceae bacterium]|nr:aminodeoxychorismate/anthranilate synthase component II [Pirellulaceae bacterium]
MLLIIDNYDSFTYNLVQRFGELDPTTEIQGVRNDQLSADEIEALNPSHLVISPGPCTPHEAGISVELVRRWSGRIPLLGVCLGHQSIGQATGGNIVRAHRLMHGKTDLIEHTGQGIFCGIPSPMIATRYHSLVIEPTTLSSEFVVTAWSHDPEGHFEIMGIQHCSHPTFGVQFHPESFLTDRGPELLLNFLQT